ncbi:MAG: hypothetical protein M1838_003906 [Thelocarpon superellum]|nr:MAG: hypothetical protein M1838_003906 [Thelocarpon superellum]
MATISSSRPSGAPASASDPPPAPTRAPSYPFTCNSCQVAFRSSDLQRAHMHSDWHRYNLKRRVASLPPITSETFAEKVLTAQSSSTREAARASFEKVCRACQRTYYSENAFQNHQGSQKHKAKLATLLREGSQHPEPDTESLMSSTFSLGEPIEGEAAPSGREELAAVVDGLQATSLEEKSDRVGSERTTPSAAGSSRDDTPPALPAVTCLFCNYQSPSLPLNVSHMCKIHGMFVPEQSYLVDLEGLVCYLHQKISALHECLYCGKVKGTSAAVQTHMRDKGHCMIAFESEAEMIEVGQFYDFRSTYSDEEEEEEAEEEDDEAEGESEGPGSHTGAKLGSKRESSIQTTTHGADGSATVEVDEAEGDGWETDSSASSLDSAELTAVPLDHTHQYQKLHQHLHHSHHDPRPHHNRDGWHSHAHTHSHAVYHSEYELHLPSGRSAGHRSLSRYYRQNLHRYPTSASTAGRRAITDASTSESEDDARPTLRERGRQVATRGTGALGMTGVTEAKRREVTATEKRERKREARENQRYQWGVDKRGNAQKHFRDPLLQ